MDETNYDPILEMIRELPEEELPDGYHDALMARVAALKTRTGPPVTLRRVNFNRVDFKRYAAVAAGLALTVMTLGAVGSFFNNAPPRDAATAGAAFESFAYADESAAGEAEHAAPSVFAETSIALAPPPGEAASIAPAASSRIAGYGAQAAAADEKKLRTAKIDIECDDLAYAIALINGLAGYNTNSGVRYFENLGDTYGTADMTRRVDAQSYEFVMGVLRSLGEVVTESESETSYAAEYRELEIRLRNARSEMDRLNALLAKATSLDNLIYIERRISEVTWRLDSSKGRMNEIDSLTQSHYIHINLASYTPPVFPVVPVPFGERLGDAFKTSAAAAASFLENAALFVAGLAVPLVTIGLVCGAFVLIYNVVRKRGTKND